MMPTVLRIGEFRFFFFSNEGREPPHIHVEAGDGYAKFRLQPATLAFSVGLSPTSLRTLRKLVAENESRLLEAWDGYFSR